MIQNVYTQRLREISAVRPYKMPEMSLLDDVELTRRAKLIDEVCKEWKQHYPQDFLSPDEERELAKRFAAARLQRGDGASITAMSAKVAKASKPVRTRAKKDVQ